MDRKTKLKQLEDRQAKQEPVSVGELDSYIKRFETVVAEFKDVLGSGTEINNVEELILQLNKIEALQPAIDKLNETIGKIKLPDYPEQVKIDGLSDLLKTLDKPQQKIDLKPIEDVTKNLKELTKAIDSIKVPEQKLKQQPSDFVPMRRVMMVGKTLMWDDSFYTGGGGGGSSSTSTSSAVTSPTDGYGYCAKSTTATYKYYFFENKDGNWYILRKTIATEVVDYAAGTGGYASVFNSSTTDPSGTPTFGAFSTIF